MKIGMLTGIWYIAESASLVESLRRAAALGFHHVDFQGVFHAGPAHLSPPERRAVKREVAALGLEVRNYVLHAPHNLASASEAELEACFAYLQDGIHMALDWGINQLMLNAGQWAYGASRKMENNDVIVLAQASMARVADQIPASDRSVPILSSPRLGMERVRDVLNQLKSV